VSHYVLCSRCGVLHHSALAHQCIDRRKAPMPVPLRRSNIPGAVGFALLLGAVIAAVQWLLGSLQ